MNPPTPRQYSSEASQTSELYRQHTLFPDVDEMLAPESLSLLAGQPITSVHRSPLQAEYALSRSHLIAVETNNGQGPRYIYARLSMADNECTLDAMAALHTAFFEATGLNNPTLVLCTLQHVYTLFSQQTGWREAGGPDEVPQRILEGWDLVETLVDPDVADIVETLLDDPTPLCTPLKQYPQTLVTEAYGTRLKRSEVRAFAHLHKCIYQVAYSGNGLG